MSFFEGLPSAKRCKATNDFGEIKCLLMSERENALILHEHNSIPFYKLSRVKLRIPSRSRSTSLKFSSQDSLQAQIAACLQPAIFSPSSVKHRSSHFYGHVFSILVQEKVATFIGAHQRLRPCQDIRPRTVHRWMQKMGHKCLCWFPRVL
jgi:hypothetical protein